MSRTKTKGEPTMSKALTIAKDFAIMQSDGKALQKNLQDNFGAVGFSAFDLDRITIPTGGGTAWQVGTLEGPQMVQAIEGIIIHRRDGRLYWAQSVEAGGMGNPPDCVSDDACQGIGMPGGPCVKCPLALFGSDPKDGVGQACKHVMQLFFLRKNDLLPVVVSLPPTSLKPMRNYLMRLTSHTPSLAYYEAVTKLELEQDTNRTGIKYAKVKPSYVGQVTGDDLKKLLAIREALEPSLARVRVDANGDDAK